MVGAALSFVNLLYGIFVLPESLAPENRRPFSLARANPIGSLRRLGRNPVVLGLSGTLLCAFLAPILAVGVLLAARVIAARTPMPAHLKKQPADGASA